MQRLQASLFAAIILSAAAISGCSAPVKSGCSSDAQCREGRVCVDGKCESPFANSVPGNNQTSNGGTNNANAALNSMTANSVVGPNNTTTNNAPNNRTTNNMVDPDLELCQQFCDKVFGSCVDQECTVSPDQRASLDELEQQCLFEGFDGDPGCVDAVKQDPQAREELEQFVNELSCESDELAQLRCGDLQLGDACGCPEATRQVGDTCTEDAECTGDGLTAGCATEDNEPPFPGGYCVRFGCELNAQRPRPEFNDQCGEDNVCLPGDGADPSSGFCLDGCFAHDECREGYQCRLVGIEGGFGQSIEPVRVCLAECSDQLRCRGPEERCNEGRCEFPCDDNNDGGPSGRMRCNALGFTCEPDPNGQEWCVLP